MKKSTILILMLILCQFTWAVDKIVLKTNEADEASGLIKSRINSDVLYTHNDSGGKPVLYLINKMGEKVGEIVLDKIKNRDWEEIAQGPGPQKEVNYLFAGEIGDNKAVYPSLKIYRFPEKRYTNYPVQDTIRVFDTIEYQYEDGARDAEAFFVDPKTKDIIIISKREEEVGVYKLEYPQKLKEINTARKICRLPMKWVVSADISQDGRKILVKTYMSIYLWERLDNEDLKTCFSRPGKPLDYELEPQGEAVCWDEKDEGYFTLSEKDETNPQILYSYQK